jgi:acyl-CoA thioester hydrolase
MLATFQRPKGTTLYVADGKPGFSDLVYHASYLRFMERGRTNYLRLLGADPARFVRGDREGGAGFAFVVRSMQIEFRKAARMDDVLDVITMSHEVRGASITLDQRIVRGEGC